MPNELVQEHEAEIAVLQVEVAHLKTDTENTKKWLSSIDGKVDDIKSRLDKQNGAIPHIQEDMRSLKEYFEKLDNQLGTLKEKEMATSFKTGLMWAGLATVVATVIATVVKLLLG